MSYLEIYGAMSERNDNSELVDPLTIGELRPLKELAEEFPLSYNSLRTYAQKGIIKARKFGNQWATTRAAVEEYLATRDADRVPKRLRRDA